MPFPLLSFLTSFLFRILDHSIWRCRYFSSGPPTSIDGEGVLRYDVNGEAGVVFLLSCGERVPSSLSLPFSFFFLPLSLHFFLSPYLLFPPFLTSLPSLLFLSFLSPILPSSIPFLSSLPLPPLISFSLLLPCLPPSFPFSSFSSVFLFPSLPSSLSSFLQL